MKAARILGPNDIRYVEMERSAYGPDDVLIRVKRADVCGTDIAIYGGDMPYLKSGATTYPITPGHEWSGVAAALSAPLSLFSLSQSVNRTHVTRSHQQYGIPGNPLCVNRGSG